MTTQQEKFRLRNMNITRVDLVDRGANQDAHIVLAKADTEGAVRRSSLADRLSQLMQSKADKPSGSPLGRDKGEKKRILRLSPEDFEVTRKDKNMIEWAIPEDKLPEGVEEAMMTMAVSGEVQMFQWMIDPLAGPPVEGQAKSAAEAFMAMRAALTQSGSLDPTDMLGGMPSEQKPQQPSQPNQKPQQKPQQQPMAKGTPGRRRALRALARAKRKNKQRMAEGKDPVVDGKKVSPSSLGKRNQTETLNEMLDIIVKGLVDVNVFAENATGEDLGDILPKDSLAELTSKLSAMRAPSNPKEYTNG